MVTVVFPAAGASRRMGDGLGAVTNKNFMELAGDPILVRTLKAFSKSKKVDDLIVAVGEDEVETVKRILRTASGLKPWKVTVGGSERQYSIANGLKLVPEQTDIVLVHDAARPLVSVKTIDEVIEAAEKFGGSIAAVREKNTVKVIDNDDFVKSTPRRAELVEVQTPQGFKKDILFRAYAQAEVDNFLGTDDAMLVERIGEKIKIVWSEYKNIKITTPEDIKIVASLIEKENEEVEKYEEIFEPVKNSSAQHTAASVTKTGIGYDVHKLVPNRKLILGGVEIDHKLGLDGHSDADVLIHAIIDALLGAAALGDIGQHFPDTDNKFKGADSCKLLAKVYDMVRAVGYGIVNIDSIVVAQKPKLAPHILKIREKLAEILRLDSDCISVKAKTEEGLGFTGHEQGISAYAVVGIEK